MLFLLCLRLITNLLRKSVASHATICATTSLISQQRLIVGKQHFIDKKNVVNPIATILSVAMMLNYSFNEKLASDSIYRAVKDVLKENFRTRDIAQKDSKICTTTKITELIIEKI